MLQNVMRKIPVEQKTSLFNKIGGAKWHIESLILMQVPQLYR